MRWLTTSIRCWLGHHNWFLEFEQLTWPEYRAICRRCGATRISGWSDIGATDQDWEV